MDDLALSPALTVAQVIDRWNTAAISFVRLRMACVGCPLSSMESLESAAMSYGIAPDLVIGEIQRAIAIDRMVEE